MCCVRDIYCFVWTCNVTNDWPSFFQNLLVCIWNICYSSSTFVFFLLYYTVHSMFVLYCSFHVCVILFIPCLCYTVHFMFVLYCSFHVCVILFIPCLYYTVHSMFVLLSSKSFVKEREIKNIYRVFSVFVFFLIRKKNGSSNVDKHTK